LKEKADELERERNRLEAEYKMKTIDALDWFPRALEVGDVVVVFFIQLLRVILS
jgi:hypothetical protein